MILTENQKISPQTYLSQDLNIITFDNGLTLIHQDVPSSSVVVADIWVNAGVICEPESWSGISHFLEHMIFKGTKNILPGDFDHLIESKGGFANAATSYDYTHFFLTTASGYIQETLPCLAEILLQAEIPDEHFYIERDVVLEELRCSTDDHNWLIFQALADSIYQHHPYRRSVLGEESLLMNNTPNQMRCYHQTHYQPENTNVVLVGNIEQSKAIDLVGSCFDNFTTPSECPPVAFDSEAPMVDIRRQRLFLPRLEHPRLFMGWMGPGIEDIEGAIALDIISMILAGGRSSRLTKLLREETKLVLNVGCDFSLQKHSSLFTISAYLGEEQSIEQVEAIIREEIYQLQTQLIQESELKACQRSLCHDFIFSTETPEQLASLYGYYHILETAELALRYPNIVKQMTAQKLQHYASAYLSTEYYAVCEAYPSC